MNFFQSEYVKKELEQIFELQQKIYKNIFFFSSMSKEDKIEHITILKELIEKQKILYTRISLSDDPLAKEMKARLMNTVSNIGPYGDVSSLLNGMTKAIDMVKVQLDSM